MSNFVANLYPDINGYTPADITNWLVASTDGKLMVLSPNSGKTVPVLQVGGADSELVSQADSETEGTVDKNYSKEGLRTNPLSLFPSSFFTPIPPQLSALLPGPLSVISNPNLLVTILAISAAATKDEVKYSYNVKTLPIKVIDNQDLEDKFFGRE